MGDLQLLVHVDSHLFAGFSTERKTLFIIVCWHQKMLVYHKSVKLSFSTEKLTAFLFWKDEPKSRWLILYAADLSAADQHTFIAVIFLQLILKNASCPLDKGSHSFLLLTGCKLKLAPDECSGLSPFHPLQLATQYRSAVSGQKLHVPWCTDGLYQRTCS